jgi:transcriptional regulator with XRE-family HTH domain
MNALDQYLSARNETASSFAERCGCDVSSITRIRNGEMIPGLALAKKIVDASGLTFEDLMPMKNGKRRG